MKQYNRGQWIPSGIRKALKRNYVLVHKGLLCWGDVPAPHMVPILRVLFVELEATLTFRFWALNIKTEYGLGMRHLCPWEQDMLEYRGLCSHSALLEHPAGHHDIPPAELEVIAVERATEIRQRLNQNTMLCRVKAKQADPVAYKSKACV